MKLWRLTRTDRLALDGEGTLRFGGRYASPGRPIVNFASEPGLAILIALRYVQPSHEAFHEEYALGWTEVEVSPERIPAGLSDDEVKCRVDEWAAARESLLVAVPSKVLPEADIVMMNPLHPRYVDILPLTTRRFTFADCLHRPPMLESYRLPTADANFPDARARLRKA